MNRIVSATASLLVGVLVWASPVPALGACEDVRSLRLEGAYERAREEAEACLEQAPERVGMMMELSRIHAAMGDVDRALAQVERALERAPDVPQYRLWRIELFLRDRRLDRARRALEALPEEVTSRPDALKVRGKFELWRMNYRGALRFLDLYLEKRPGSPWGLYYRGIARENVGRWHRARDDYRRACRLASDWTRPCEAADELEGDLNDVGGLLERARRLAGEGEGERAVALLDRAVERLPDRASLKYWRIRLLMREGEIERAQTALDALPARVMDRPTAMKLRAKIEMQQGDDRAAVESLNLYLGRRKKAPRAHEMRARARRRLGEWEGAIDDYQRACSLAEGWMVPCREEDALQRIQFRARRLLERSRHRAEAGRLERALELVNRAIEVREPGDELQAWRFSLLVRTERYGRAVRARSDLPDSVLDRPEVLRARARLAERGGDRDDARHLWSRYLAASPDDAAAHYHRGVLRVEAGRFQGADSDFERACRLDPSHIRACRASRGRTSAAAAGGPIRRVDFRSGLDLSADGSVGYSTAIEASRWLARGTRLEVDAEWRSRSFGGGRVHDGLVGVAGRQLLDNGARIGGGGTAAIDPDVVPDWHAYIEGGYRFARDVEAGLRYWRIQYAGPGEHVLSPRATFDVGALELRVREFVSLSDLGEIHLTGLIDANYDFAGPIRASFGLGLGDRSDFVELHRLERDSHLLGRAGFRYALGPTHALGFEVTHRRDELEFPDWGRTRLQMVWEVRGGPDQ